MNVDQVYKTVEEMFKNVDPICEEYIIYLVGFEGFYTLIENDRLIDRGLVDGKRSYSLFK